LDQDSDQDQDLFLEPMVLVLQLVVYTLNDSKQCQTETSALSVYSDINHLVNLLASASWFIRLADLVWEPSVSVAASVVCLSTCPSHVRSRKLHDIHAKFRHSHGKSGSPSKNMTSDFASDFAPELAKYTKRSHKPQNSAK